MDTVTVTRTFESNLEDMVAFCRTLDSRTHFPGAVLQYEKRDDELHFGVGMRLRAATMTDIVVKETLGDVERLDGGAVKFDSTSWATWPDGHSGASSEYLFTPGEDGGPGTLRMTYSYTAPGKSLVKTKELPAFHVAMEKVISRYVERLIAAKAPAGAAKPARVPVAATVASAASSAPQTPQTPQTPPPAPQAASAPQADPAPDMTAAQSAPAAGGAITGGTITKDAEGQNMVVVSRNFDGEMEGMVAFTRSLSSRTSWPGAQLEAELGDTLYYGVGMRLRGAAMTDITVKEELSEVEHLPDGEVRYTTTQRITWPEDHGDAVTEYRFIPGDPGEPNTLQFSYTYATPSTKLVKPKERPAFRQAMLAVSNRYLKNLSKAKISA